MAENRGIVMCAGGVTYLTNAYIAVRLLRHLGCMLPVEIWYQDESEVDDRVKSFFDELTVIFRSARDTAIENALPVPTGWALKPFAMLHSEYDELLYLDSDNFVVLDPTYLFETPEFIEYGAAFWPDLRRSSPYNPVWEILGLFPRDEWEFESGQILLKKSDFLEPLRFALEMNYEASRYYKHIWGDKDTFRFAWHKFGRRFVMPETGVELLTAANGPKNGGVMCQHDFNGRRVFQHRNILKWQLFGSNPFIAGFFHEPLCRRFLNELRSRWDGRLNVDAKRNFLLRKKIAKALVGPVWLINGVGRLKTMRVTTTDNLYGMRDRVFSITRDRSVSPGVLFSADETADEIRNQSEEVRFFEDGRLEGLASLGLWHWDVGRGAFGDFIHIVGDRNVEMFLRPCASLPFPYWEGALGERDSFRPVRMSQLFDMFSERKEKSQNRKRPASKSRLGPLLLTNSSNGIGDHIHSLYVAVGATAVFREVVLHSRHAEWLSRVSHPGLTITNLPPQNGEDYTKINLGLRPDLLNRHAQSKLDWYAGLVGHGCSPMRPKFIDTDISAHVVEFSRYVVFSPYAAHATRNWARAHWIRLTHRLEEEGYQILVLGTRAQESGIVETFGKSNAAWLVDLDPATVCNLLLGAEFVVGLDSGISHLCGLLGVRTYSIHAHLPPEFLFGSAPSIISIFAEGDCRGCRFRSDRGYTKSCEEGCSELVGIPVSRVAETILKNR